MNSRTIMFVVAILFHGCHGTPNKNAENNPFPEIVTSSNCRPQHNQLDLCGVVGLTDAVVIGEVQEVKLNSKPALQYVGGGDKVMVDNCSAPVKIGIKISLKVEYADRNNISQIIDVFVGPEQLERFSPMPISDKLGNLIWVGDENNNKTRIEKGERIGMFLYNVGGDYSYRWSILGNPLFFIDNENSVRLQRQNGGCNDWESTGIDGMEKEFFFRTVESCEHRGLGFEGYDESWWMPICLEDLGKSKECTFDSDCNPGSGCFEGTCR